MGLKLCPRCERPYLDTEEFCPRCPKPAFGADPDSYGAVGCALFSVLALAVMLIFWIFFIGSMFIR